MTRSKLRPVEISLLCIGHLIGYIWKCWNLLFCFCHLIGFTCLFGPGFSKRTENLALALMREGIIKAKAVTKPANFTFYHELIPKAAMLKRMPTWKHHEENEGLRKCRASRLGDDLWACYVIVHKTNSNLTEDKGGRSTRFAWRDK